MRTRTQETLIPDVALSAGERAFRVAWLAALRRTDSDRPELSADFVARQGRALLVVDIRESEALLGPLGHVPGADWVPMQDIRTLLDRVKPFEPMVLVCEDGRRSLELAAALESMGLKLVEAMRGGMQAWREQGLATERDPELLQRRGRLSAVPPWSPDTNHAAFTQEEIQQHVGHPRSIRRLKLAAFLLNGRMSCVDGRDHVAVVGTPGGDAGELILTLAAAEQLRGKPLSDAAVTRLLALRLESFGRFAFHTDTTAADQLIAAIRADPRTRAAAAGVAEASMFRSFFASPPAEIRPALVELFVQPEHLGCGHLRMMLQHPERYGVRDGLPRAVLSAALLARWGGTHDLEVTPLPGTHAEGAVVNIRVGATLEAFSHVPLVAPSIGGRQMFINHPDVAGFLRRQLALWVCQQSELVGLTEAAAPALFQVAQALHRQQLMATLRELAPGLPIYDVIVQPDGKSEVKAVGTVPSAPA